MRLTSALAGALLLAPLPATADVTATYALGTEKLTVEVDDSGDYRADVAGKFTLIRHGSDEFVVVTHNGKARAARSDVFFALLKTKSASDAVPRETAAPMRFVTTQGKDEVVAGRKGSSWLIAIEGQGADAAAVAVVSSDAQLAPVGDVLRQGLARALDSLGPALGGFAEVRDQLNAVFGKGALLRFALPPATIALESVKDDAIAAERFASPTGLLDAAALDAALSEETVKAAKP
jgi:hypothetical protein